MNSSDTSQYLEEAIRIGDDLLSKAIIDKEGYKWKTMNLSVGGDNEINWQVSEGLYSGVAGIVFFYLELHRHTKHQRYMDAVLGGALWLENYCKENTTNYHAFYTGRLGVAFLMVQLASYLDDKIYLSKALEVSKDCDSFLTADMDVDDLINGTSGSILALLHVHDATKDETVLGYINKFITHLIDRISVSENGFYWDRSVKNIQGLCGFSHGAAGVGYVFLELGYYFGNSTFYQIAELAFAYENHSFKPDKGNWPDYRKGFYSEKTFLEHKEKYLEGDVDFFSEPSDMCAWCHGAAGIGLSRVRAYELLGKEVYLEDLEKSIEKTKKVSADKYSEYMSYTLCHGGGGNALLFLEANRIKPDQKYTDLTRRVADYVLKYRKEGSDYRSGFSSAGTQSDISLFMGDAGIGLFMLSAAIDMKQPSIMKPDVNGTYNGPQSGTINMSNSDLVYQLLHKFFPETVSRISESAIKESNVELGGNLISTLKSSLGEIIKANREKNLIEIFDFEVKKIDLDTSVGNDSYHHISRLIEAENNGQLLNDEGKLLTTKLTFPKTYRLSQKPNEISASDNTNDDQYVILMSSAGQILEFPLNDFAYTLIEKFEKGVMVQKVIDELITDFEAETDQEIEQVKQACLAQIKEALAHAILVQSDSLMA